MLCFEVTINGKKICTAGVGEHGTLSTILTWVKASAEVLAASENDYRTGEPGLLVSGLKDGKHLNWLNEDLALGDEISIKLIESDDADKPIDEYREDPQLQQRQRKMFYEKLKQEFEPEV